MLKLIMIDNESKKEKIKFWEEGSQRDLEMMDFLFKECKFSYALFFGQMGLEKLLKSIYISKKDEAPPYIHDLVKIAAKCDLTLNIEDKKILETITGFNINARYDDYKDKFYRTATKEYTTKHISEIKRIKKWLEKQI